MESCQRTDCSGKVFLKLATIEFCFLFRCLVRVFLLTDQFYSLRFFEFSKYFLVAAVMTVAMNAILHVSSLYISSMRFHPLQRILVDMSVRYRVQSVEMSNRALADIIQKWIDA